MNRPLPDLVRPKELDDVVGQKHLLGKDKVLRRLIESGNIPNLIFFGPSGTGKTTLAELIASKTSKTMYKINATTEQSKDLKTILDSVNTLEGRNGILLYIDEIQYFNKKQQQLLLDYIEKGEVTLICSTTENPYFYIYNALISRSTIFEFKPVDRSEIKKALLRTIKLVEDDRKEKIEIDNETLEYLSSVCGGDVRKAIYSLEILLNSCNHYDKTYFINLEQASQIGQSSQMRYDRDGDNHYDLLSAFQKSIRGSDPDASIFYLAKILNGGDLLSACRRLLVIASEDIGLAYPNASAITKACVDSALQLGLPEARIPLANATIMLATAPKSNSAICAIDKALEVIKEGKGNNIPNSLLDTHYKGSKDLNHGEGYKYSHDYENHYVKQQFLPDDLINEKFYEYQDNKVEEAAKIYWQKIKNKK